MSAYFRFEGVCESADAAALLAALEDFGFDSTLLAALAAFVPVCREFLLAMVCLISSRSD
jgi:hypothetical protein